MILGGGARRKNKTRSKKSKHSKMVGRKKKTRKRRGGNENADAIPPAITEYCDKYNKPEAECDKSHKKAYHKLSLKHHPDKGGNEEHFKKLGECHECSKSKLRAKR